MFYRPEHGKQKIKKILTKMENNLIKQYKINKKNP